MTSKGKTNAGQIQVKNSIVNTLLYLLTKNLILTYIRDFMYYLEPRKRSPQYQKIKLRGNELKGPSAWLGLA